MNGQKGLKLRKGKAGHYQQPGGPHKQSTPQGQLGEGVQEARIMTYHHNRCAPRQLTHLLRNDIVANNVTSATSMLIPGGALYW